jgi:hypothetical protein
MRRHFVALLVVLSLMGGLAVSSTSIASADPVTVPGAPTSLVATPGNGSVSIAFMPGADGGAAITNYEYSTDNGATWKAFSPINTMNLVLISVRSDAATGLVTGTTYLIKLRAVNPVGSGAESPAVSVTPATVPGAPTSVVGVSGNAQVTVSWTAPVSNGGSVITRYTVSASPQVGGVTRTCTTTLTSCVVYDLTNGVAYRFTVKARNAVNEGAASGESSAVTPATVPGGPTSVVGVSGNAQVAVSWVAPISNGGSVLTGYTVSASPQVGGVTRTCTTALTSCIVTGLTNGVAYSFTVTATNTVGTGAASGASSAVTPATVPGVPTAVVITPGNREVTVSWTAPANNGAQITGYKVQVYGAAGAALTRSCLVNATTSSATTCTITDLTNDTTYGFAVNATNSKGSSAYSTVTQVQPTLVKILRGNAKVTASWTFTAPATVRGSTFLNYQVQAYTAAGAVVVGKTCTPVGSAKTCEIGGLTNNTAYSIAVISRYANGTSITTAKSITVAPSNVTGASVPAAPTGVTAVTGVKQATVSWTASVANGATVTVYTVQAYNPTTNVAVAFTCATSVTSCIVTGLTTGNKYYFKVTARNDVGNSAASSATTTVTAG